MINKNTELKITKEREEFTLALATFKNKVNELRPNLRGSLIIGLLVSMACITTVYAIPDVKTGTGFDIHAAAAGLFDPILKVVTDNFGKAVVGIGAAVAFVSNGDLYTRAKSFGIGAFTAGLVMGAVKLGFGL